jgi:hypothetical protein
MTITTMRSIMAGISCRLFVKAFANGKMQRKRPQLDAAIRPGRLTGHFFEVQKEPAIPRPGVAFPPQPESLDPHVP